MSRVDVIIPVFNTPLHYVDEALASLQGQDFVDWTAWIINDGSAADYTGKLKQSLDARGDSRIVYLNSDHKGPAGSRNVGLVEGAAPYVALLDSDDCWLPGHLATQVARLEADPSLTLVHGHSRIIDSDSKPHRSHPPMTGLNELSVRDSFLRLLGQNFVNASSVVVRRSALAEVGYFDGSFPCLVDKELWMRLLDKGARFYYDDDVVLLYRVHPHNISKNTDLLLATRRRIIDKAAGFVKSNPAFADIDWPATQAGMTRHMYREAAEGYYRQGRYGDAIRYASPGYAGFSVRSSMLMLRSAVGSVMGTKAA